MSKCKPKRISIQAFTQKYATEGDCHTYLVAVKSIVNSPAVCTSAMNAIIRLLSPPAHSCIVAVCP